MSFRKKKSKERLTIEAMLDEKLESLAHGELNAEQKKATIEDIDKLNSWLNDCHQREFDIYSKPRDRAVKYTEVGTSLILTISRVISNVMFFKEGLEFEKTGSISSFFFRDIFSHRDR